MKKELLFKLVTFLIVPIIAVLVLEVCLYLLGFATTYDQEDPFLGFETVDRLFEKVDVDDASSGAMYATRKSKLIWFNYQEFRAVKPESGYRIFCLGGSTTFGRPYSEKTAFSNWLQVILRSLDPSTYYEVVNVGGVSYASYRIVNLLKELVNYKPDLFIVYSGHNEFLEERTYSDIIEEPALLRQLRTQLNRLRTYSLARSIWLGFQDRGKEEAQQKYQMTGEVSAILDQSRGLDLYHRDTEEEKAILDHSRYNLERMTAIAEDHGVEILFVVPPSNEKDFSPFKSQFCNSLNAEKSKKWYELYGDGQSELNQGNFQEALLSFRQAFEIDSCQADHRYRIGRCLFALGRYQEAKREFDTARDLDVAPLRSTNRIQQIVREIGQDKEIPTVDLVAILEKKSLERFGYPILGNEFFLDHAHPTIEVHQMLAEEITNVLVKRGLVEPKKRWEQLNLKPLYDSVLATTDSIFYGVRDLNLAKVLKWAGKNVEAVPFVLRAAKSLPSHPEAQHMLGLVYQEQGRHEQAAQAFQKALTLDSTFAKAHNSLGTVYSKMNLWDRALESFRAAIRHHPAFADAYYNLGNTLYRMDRTQDAVGGYQQALSLNPMHSRARNNLGVIYMLQGDLAKAERSFVETLDMEPHNVEACSNLGIIYFRKGDLGKAQSMFEEVLELKPGDVFASEWLNRVRKGTN